MTTKETDQVSQLYSDLVIDGFTGKIEIDGHRGLTELDASVLKAGSPDADAKAHRFELISVVKAGKHVELAVTAQTFAQTKKPNRRYLRLGDDNLSARAPSWKGQPYLTDHNTWSMSASKGTILSSKAVEIDGGMAFEQKLHAVKSDAVIGILDGTFNKFSIGWWPDGPILCSVHGCDVMKADGCNCWPGDKVTMSDGRERVVEFVFTNFKGKETSSVVIPAVQDTHVGDVRAALAAELNIPRTRHVNRNKETAMLFHRLAVALGLTALSESSDEDRAIAAVSALQARANTAEAQLGSANVRLTQAEAAVKTLTAAQIGVQVDAILQQDGFAAGRLRRQRDPDGKLTAGPIEKWLRELGIGAGLEVMKAQLTQMPIIVPVGERQAERAKDPARTVLGETDQDVLTEENPYLRNAAELTGQKVGDLVAFANAHVQGGR